MQTRLVEYFLALEREDHFARAAAHCNVSQPTLSAGIAALETQLGKRLIRRDRKYGGLTAEGTAILPWARQLVAAAEALEQAAETARGPLKGELRLGAIPAAMPAIGSLVAAMLARHPGLNVSIRALTSRQIERELAAFELDAGLTYLDFEPPAHALSVPLFVERTMLISAVGGVTVPDPLEWTSLAGLPLCLLHQGMQNRQILDARLSERGLALRPLVTADSYPTLLALVQHGSLCSIIPDSHASLLDGLAWACTHSVDMAHMARFAMEFCAVESCGKCTPCRIGSTRGIEVIDRMIAARDVAPASVDAQQSGYLGKALYSRSPSRIDTGLKAETELLRDLCDTMKFGSLCALGGFTPYPVLSALDHFPEDFGMAAPAVEAAE